MPEAPVYEDHCAPCWEDQIGVASQIAAVKSESVTGPVDQASHLKLRLHALASDTSHVFTAAVRRQFVHEQNLVGF